MELRWLKENRDLLTSEDHKRLEGLGVFRIVDTGKMKLPLIEAVLLMGVVHDICRPYLNKLTN